MVQRLVLRDQMSKLLADLRVPVEVCGMINVVREGTYVMMDLYVSRRTLY